MMHESLDHYDSCHLGDVCKSLELITQSSKKILAIRDIETKKVSLMRNFFRSIEPDVIYSAERVQDLRSLLWQDSSGIYGKGGNTIVLGVQEGIGSGSIMASR